MHPIRKNPFRLETKAMPVFSNNPVTKKNTDTKITDVKVISLLSFARNGKTIKKSPIGNMKNCTPPHEARPNASNTPAPATFAMETYPSLDFIPLISR